MQSRNRTHNIYQTEACRAEGGIPLSRAIRVGNSDYDVLSIYVLTHIAMKTKPAIWDPNLFDNGMDACFIYYYLPSAGVWHILTVMKG